MEEAKAATAVARQAAARAEAGRVAAEDRARQAVKEVRAPGERASVVKM